MGTAIESKIRIRLITISISISVNPRCPELFVLRRIYQSLYLVPSSAVSGDLV